MTENAETLQALQTVCASRGEALDSTKLYSGAPVSLNDIGVPTNDLKEILDAMAAEMGLNVKITINVPPKTLDHLFELMIYARRQDLRKRLLAQKREGAESGDTEFAEQKKLILL